MLSVKKATKFAVANLIIVSTVFSSVTPAIAQSDKSSKDESFAVGNTKNPKKCYLFSWRWHGSII